MVFQEPMTSMDPVMRIGPQVEEALVVHTKLSAEERRARALQAMADAELPEPGTLYRKYPHELSGECSSGPWWRRPSFQSPSS